MQNRQRGLASSAESATSLLARRPRCGGRATADGYDAEVRPDGEIRATFHFTWRGAQRSFAVAVPGEALWSARDASRDVGAACDRGRARGRLRRDAQAPRARRAS
ncbi:hypothetical protein JL721_11149 [Aureococcus anophagefferens]|nr:hypothetical protein JL721_11149 [Aureococcus anophagefferens]